MLTMFTFKFSYVNIVEKVLVVFYLNILSTFIILTLFAAAILHFYWSFGGKYLLDRAIPSLDDKPIISPGNFLTFCVGLVLLSFSSLVYTTQFYDLLLLQESTYIIYFTWFLSAIFSIRAIGDFRFIGFFKKIRSTKFAEYDTLYYSPLFLFLSLYFAFISSKADL